MYIPNDAMHYIEKMIYLPMLLIVLEQDYMLLEDGAFKLKRPYLSLIEEARQQIESDLEITKAYLKENHIRVVRGKRDELFTEYHFHFAGVLDCRRYSNIRLRNYSEQLLKEYICKVTTG